MAVDFGRKNKYSIDDLLCIMKVLRGENGCPWDREQTHSSIRKNFIEETYEVVEAIDSDDKELMKEELGDVLLQVIFHTVMEEEKMHFDFSDVCDGICKKLITRHPHIFGDVTAETSEKVLENWDAIKKQEKNQSTYTESLKSVPKMLPALMRSEKIQHRASRAGFDFENLEQVMPCIDAELQELKDAVAGGSKDEISEELGDLLFSVVNVSRFLKTDAEQSLYNSCDKFISRFEKVEELARERNIDMKTAGMEVLDGLWDEVKKLG